MNYLILFLLILSLGDLKAQQVIVNADGTHSVQYGNVIVNPNGTHSLIYGNVQIHSDGTHSIKQGNSIVNSNGTHSLINGSIINHSNGKTSIITGNTVVQSDGKSSTKNGNMIISSDGTYSVVNGNMVVHSDGTYSVVNGNWVVHSKGTSSGIPANSSDQTRPFTTAVLNNRLVKKQREWDYQTSYYYALSDAFLNQTQDYQEVAEEIKKMSVKKFFKENKQKYSRSKARYMRHLLKKDQKKSVEDLTNELRTLRVLDW